MGEIFTVADIRRNSGWREALEERQNYESRRREIEKERERAACVAAEKQQPAATNNSETSWDAIDERIRWWFDFYFSGHSEDNNERGLYADAIGGAMGTIGQKVRDEFKRADEEMQRAFEARLAELRERFLASNNQATWVSWVDDRIKATFGYGRDVLLAEVKDVVEGAQRSLEMKLVELEERLRAVPGKLPVAKTWRQESVTYEGEFVCHEGALWQACKDTAQAPGGLDWLCVARAGRDGLSLSVRGGFNAYKKYRQLDVVTFDGTSFVAKCNNPGICPGDGWQMLAPRGKVGDRGPPGSRGMKGEKGARGEAAPTITNWTIDRKRYCAIPTMSDGKVGAPLELRELFEQYQLETS